MEPNTDDLKRMSDPELMTRYTATRSRLVNTPSGKSGHKRVKAEYDGLLAEYRRRIDEARAYARGVVA
jgi:hypothetical protein